MAKEDDTVPRYIVWKGMREFWLCGTLAEACDTKVKYGGTIYEPLGMTHAERIANEREHFQGD